VYRDGYWYCERCGLDWPEQFEQVDARVAARVSELFWRMFPPGSDGPPEGFDIGALYEQVECELSEGAVMSRSGIEEK